MDIRPKARIGEWLVLGFFVAVAALVFQQIATSLTEQGAASGDPLANAALFPRMVAILMLGLAALIGLRTALGRMAPPPEHATFDATPDQPPEPPAVRARMMLGTIALLCLYLVALRPLGFHIATTAAIAAMFALLGVRPLWWAALAGAGLNLLVAFVFEGLLKVVLPTGVFGISLPLSAFGG